MEDKDPLEVKVVLLGESGVGKTCIISRFVNNVFENNTMTTISATYAAKVIPYTDAGEFIKFEIWDTAGQEKYRSLTRVFYKDARVAVLVYDITRRETFEEIKNYWYQQIKDNAPENTIIGLAANKSDLYYNENVTEEEGRNYANEIGAVFKMTSSYENLGIGELFKAIGYKVLDPNFKVDIDKIQVNPNNNNDNNNNNNNKIKLNNKKVKKKKRCC